MKKALFLVLAGFLLSCQNNHNVPYDAPAPTPPTTETNAIKNWNKANFPILIYVPSELQTYQSSIINAQNTWNDALKLEGYPEVYRFVFNSGKPNTQWTKQYDSLYDNYFGLFAIMNPDWNYPDIGSGVLAFTGTLSQNGKIIHADVLFNFQNYSFGDVTNGDPDVFNKIDFESVLVHELGHFLGLNHITAEEDPNSIMLPKISRGTAKRTLSTGDVSRIRALYHNN